MQQLKFFTDHAETIRNTCNDIASMGITPNHYQIFTKDNSRHQFDGLILANKKSSDELEMDKAAAWIAAGCIVGCIGMYAHWFTPATLFCLLMFIGLFSFFRALKKTDKEEIHRYSGQVYFLVLDVAESDAQKISKKLRNRTRLVSA